MQGSRVSLQRGLLERDPEPLCAPEVLCVRIKLKWPPRGPREGRAAGPDESLKLGTRGPEPGGGLCVESRGM